MSPDTEQASVARIEKTRGISRLAANKCAEQGVNAEELAIAGLYTAFDLAAAHAGPGIAAVEWLRLGADVIERQIMAKVR